MPSQHTRLSRERKTIQRMIQLYCREQHQHRDGLCSECQELLTYALARLGRCPFQERKTTCAKCPVHCYAADMRDRIRAVMRYAGPRMLYRHPFLALCHLADSLRKEPLR
ncbi:MAG: nitrous oxide-stimulated promoter family protein [Anaerolineae bacterium]|nr:nitrous oxide-stimulated promoter family protein [Anaerolineae bacterium]